MSRFFGNEEPGLFAYPFQPLLQVILRQPSPMARFPYVDWLWEKAESAARLFPVDVSYPDFLKTGDVG